MEPNTYVNGSQSGEISSPEDCPDGNCLKGPEILLCVFGLALAGFLTYMAVDTLMGSRLSAGVNAVAGKVIPGELADV